jgi:hypothetical protein
MAHIHQPTEPKKDLILSDTADVFIILDNKKSVRIQVFHDRIQIFPFDMTMELVACQHVVGASFIP